MDQLRPATAICAVALVLALIGLGPAVAAGPGGQAAVDVAATPAPAPSGETDISTTGGGSEAAPAAGPASAAEPAPAAGSATQEHSAPADAAPGSARAPERGPQQQPAPTPSSTTTSPTPTPASSPSPGPGGGSGRGDTALSVATRASRLLGQVGDNVNYTVSVANEGDAAEDIAVVAEVPIELDIAGVPLDPRADAISQGRHGDAEDIVWILKDVRPGEEIDLAWTGRVVAAGDLRATTSVEARAQSVSAQATTDTFLATEPAVAARKTTTEPPMVKRKVIRFVPVEGESGSVAGAILPVTGWSPSPLVRGAGVAIAVGLLLLVIAGVRKRNAAVIVVVALGIAACTQAQDSAAPPEPDTTVGSEATPDDDDDRRPRDRVKGRQIRRGGGEGAAAENGAGTEVAVPETTAPDPGAPVRFERVVVTVTEPAEVIEQGSRDGDNFMSFTWDEAAREIVLAASSIRFTDQPSSLTSTLSSDAEGLLTDVVLANTSDAAMRVRGTLTLDVMQGGGVIAELRSDPIDVLLEPGGQALASFRYLLPSGDFSVMSGFEASS